MSEKHDKMDDIQLQVLPQAHSQGMPDTPQASSQFHEFFNTPAELNAAEDIARKVRRNSDMKFALGGIKGHSFTEENRVQFALLYLTMEHRRQESEERVEKAKSSVAKAITPLLCCPDEEMANETVRVVNLADKLVAEEVAKLPPPPLPVDFRITPPDDIEDKVDYYVRHQAAISKASQLLKEGPRELSDNRGKAGVRGQG